MEASQLSGMPGKIGSVTFAAQRSFEFGVLSNSNIEECFVESRADSDSVATINSVRIEYDRQEVIL